ncbi:uncharacterized protein GGS25DRAFT_506903 [Hypoxylon fragiforme]|uniref:uncharacterized protein n=1 Tax=Hypoxylon fragiforme TaxID=63214 RepID=UPI0020C728E5|nr:uncharacterized protein GGS25DRAFT_506903 [Hypoxylon fragiforme]KAI2604102.1 hypothetical protein GGS25DRAFT_506903 [Hypoxylon fragiforme]
MYVHATAEVDGKKTHGGYLMDWELFPLYSFFYTDEGKVVMERLWEETLTELEFAGVRGILASTGCKT